MVSFWSVSPLMTALTKTKSISRIGVGSAEGGLHSHVKHLGPDSLLWLLGDRG